MSFSDSFKTCAIASKATEATGIFVVENDAQITYKPKSQSSAANHIYYSYNFLLREMIFVNGQTGMSHTTSFSNLDSEVVAEMHAKLISLGGKPPALKARLLAQDIEKKGGFWSGDNLITENDALITYKPETRTGVLGHVTYSFDFMMRQMVFTNGQLGISQSTPFSQIDRDVLGAMHAKLVEDGCKPPLPNGQASGTGKSSLSRRVCIPPL